MFTSVTDLKRRAVLRHAAGELIAAIFLALLGAVYEYFSFGVWSYAMVYSFAFPLAAGLTVLFAASWKRPPQKRTLSLFGCASATFAVGSVAAGIITIYGTDSILLKFYPVLGSLMLLVSVYSYIADRHSSGEGAEQES
ncbi:MAG: hypothetical protein IKP95_07330 [Ruminococcus sp.]|nr:hypothetical protein [Ruminococcus sp.]